MFDIQKIGFSKRISAFLADLIAFFIFTVGIGTILSGIIGYDAVSEKLEKIVTEYEQIYIYDVFNEEFGTESKPLSNKEIDKLIEENLATYGEWQKEQIRVRDEALLVDEEAMNTCYKAFMLSVLNITISILISYVVLEIVVPLLLKNGQTIGKKVFGIGLMRIDGVKITPLQLIVRTILGKYTIETMIPLLLMLAVYFSLLSPDLVLFALAVIVVLVVAECVIFIKSGMTDLIHDKMALTICVDIQSQLIFETEDELIEYKRTHPTTSGDGKPLSPVAESLFSVYSSMGRAESVKVTENPKNDGSYSGIQLGNIDVDSSDVFAEKETEYKEKIEAEYSSEELIPTEEASLPDAILENDDVASDAEETNEETSEELVAEEEATEEAAESEDLIEENPAEEAVETEPEEEIPKE